MPLSRPRDCRFLGILRPHLLTNNLSLLVSEESRAVPLSAPHPCRTVQVCLMFAHCLRYHSRSGVALHGAGAQHHISAGLRMHVRLLLVYQWQMVLFTISLRGGGWFLSPLPEAGVRSGTGQRRWNSLTLLQGRVVFLSLFRKGSHLTQKLVP